MARCDILSKRHVLQSLISRIQLCPTGGFDLLYTLPGVKWKSAMLWRAGGKYTSPGGTLYSQSCLFSAAYSAVHGSLTLTRSSSRSYRCESKQVPACDMPRRDIAISVFDVLPALAILSILSVLQLYRLHMHGLLLVLNRLRDNCTLRCFTHPDFFYCIMVAFVNFLINER